MKKIVSFFSLLVLLALPRNAFACCGLRAVATVAPSAAAPHIQPTPALPPADAGAKGDGFAGSAAGAAASSATTGGRTSTGSTGGAVIYASTGATDAGVLLGGAADAAGGAGLRNEDFARAEFSLTELIVELSADDLRKLQPLIRLIVQCDSEHVKHMWDLSAQYFAIALSKKIDVQNLLMKESFRWFLCALFRTWLDLHCFTHDNAILVPLIMISIRRYWKDEWRDFLKSELTDSFITYFSEQVRNASNTAVCGSETAACMLQSPEWLFEWDVYREQLNPAIFDRSKLYPTDRARRKSAPAIDTYNPVTLRRGSVPNLTAQREEGIKAFGSCIAVLNRLVSR